MKKKFADGGNVNPAAPMTLPPMLQPPSGGGPAIQPNPMNLQAAQPAPAPASPQSAYPPPPQAGMFRKGGAVKTFKKGGSVKSSASRRGDGIATKGKTRGKFI